MRDTFGHMDRTPVEERIQKAVREEKDRILKHLLFLETELNKEDNDLIEIGKQRAYRAVRSFIQS